jgi:hypothetical protein
MKKALSKDVPNSLRRESTMYDFWLQKPKEFRENINKNSRLQYRRFRGKEGRYLKCNTRERGALA